MTLYGETTSHIQIMQDSKIGQSHTKVTVEIAAAALETSLLPQFIPSNVSWVDTYASLSVTFTFLA